MKENPFSSDQQQFGETPPEEPSPAEQPSRSPAPVMPRIGAFLADIFLLFAALILINHFLLLPQHPEAQDELERYYQEYEEYEEALEEAETEEELETLGPRPEPSEEAQAFIRAFYLATLILFFAGFFAGELLTKGASPGKLLFRLQVIWRQTGQTPTWSITLIRSLTKAVAIAVVPIAPFLVLLFFLNYFIFFFNNERRAGHDYLARTQVVFSVRQPASDA